MLFGCLIKHCNGLQEKRSGEGVLIKRSGMEGDKTRGKESDNGVMAKEVLAGTMLCVHSWRRKPFPCELTVPVERIYSAPK